MPRTARASQGGICFHAINRGNRRATVFHNSSDYDAFIGLMQRASLRVPMRTLAYCLMPNHFHFVLWPYEDGDLSRWMHWLLTAHVRRYHRVRGSSGRVWQGRFKGFPIQTDRHLLAVMRYTERNPLRAKLVARAEDWMWSSISDGCAAGRHMTTADPPIAKPDRWSRWVNLPQTAAEVDAIRRCTSRNAPYGGKAWCARTAEKLGLESSLRSVGRPPRTAL